eukprot:scaffold19879_cov174-Amphora_coffeaeformis.AAC.5
MTRTRDNEAFPTPASTPVPTRQMITKGKGIQRRPFYPYYKGYFMSMSISKGSSMSISTPVKRRPVRRPPVRKAPKRQPRGNIYQKTVPQSGGVWKIMRIQGKSSRSRKKKSMGMR